MPPFPLCFCFNLVQKECHILFCMVDILEWFTQDLFLYFSGILQGKRDSEPSPLAITGVPMVSSSSTIAPIKSLLQMSDSGCRRLSVMQVRMSTNFLLGTNVTSLQRRLSITQRRRCELLFNC